MGAQQRTALVSIVAAAVLVGLKLVTGIVTGSVGLISAGVESSGDVVAAVVTFIAIRVAHRPADQGHPFGHGRVENLSALGEAAILAAGGAFIVTEAISHLQHGSSADAAWYTFVVIGAAIAIDISRTVISLRSAKEFRSAALRSNAFHFAADFVGSVAVLVGLIFVRAGYDSADAITALFVSLLIFGGAARLIWENSNTLMDRAPDQLEATARHAIESLGLPLELRRLRLRESGGRAFADVVVAVPPASAVGQAHRAADAIESALERALPGSDIVVHVEPASAGQDLRERVLAAALSIPQVREAHNVNVFELPDQTAVSLHLKLPEELPLAASEALATEVEQAIKAEAPQIDVVHAHVEPLSQPAHGSPLEGDAATALRAFVAGAVGEQSSGELLETELLDTDDGKVAFLTVGLPPATSLKEAHRVASEIEARLHELASVAEVVVQTVAQPGAESG